MSRCAPTNAPSAAIERHPWAASCSSPGLKWILTSMLPLPDTTWTLVFRPPRETPVFCQIFVGRFGVSFSPFERLFLGRFGFGQSCGLSVIA